MIRQIALLSTSKKVSAQDLMRVSAALQRQATRDLFPIWNVKATVDAFSSPADVPPDYWKITVMDKIPAKGAAGFHLDSHGQPFADVQWSPTWSLTASHECLEMLVDPFGHQLAAGPSPIASQGRVTFLVEVCDPCEGQAYAYTINTGSANEVLVSDFYTPEYFSPVQSSGVRYSFRGNIHAPRQVLNGGYLSWQNPADDHIWQVFGPVVFGHFVDQGKGTLSREKSDGLAQGTRSKGLPKKAKAVRGGGRIRLMADAGQCSLTRDPFTGVLSGTSGNQTTVQIQDPSGAAVFQSISYAGSQIGSNTASASFAIKSGNNSLSFLYAAPTPGVTITVADPCGTMLDLFPNDLANPVRVLTVAA
jgi:hypothetical protein